MAEIGGVVCESKKDYWAYLEMVQLLVLVPLLLGMYQHMPLSEAIRPEL